MLRRTPFDLDPRVAHLHDAGHLSTVDGYGPWPAGEQLLAELS